MPDVFDYMCAWAAGEYDAFSKLIEESVKENREIGLNICQSLDGNFQFGPKCSGAECSVTLPKDCGTISKVGTFHTHTEDPSVDHTKFSGADILESVLSDEKLSCLGYKKDGVNHVSCITFNVPELEGQSKDELITHLKSLSFYSKQMDINMDKADGLERQINHWLKLPKEKVEPLLPRIRESMRELDRLRAKAKVDLGMEERVKNRLLAFMKEKGYVKECNG
ncbi:MAG: hypothetical protein WC554_04025 [Clostridia bacterium]|jgi:hypothetical protein